MIYTVILTIVILSVIILVHEFGHYIMSRYFKVNVLEFSIGMGPKIYGIGIFSIRLLPFGGYVQIENEDLDSIGIGKKFIVLIAGIVMNMILGLLALFAIFTISGKGYILANTLGAFLNIFYMTFKGIAMLFTGKASVNDMVGPVGLPLVLKQFTGVYGYFVGSMFMTSIISINIGILNIIPIPGLDGGRILFTILQMVGIKISKEKEQYIHIFGFLILFSLMVYMVIHDISRY